MDREAIKELVIQKLRTDRQTIYKSYATHLHATNNAATPAESTYDTTRSEMGEVTDALARRIAGIEVLITQVGSLRATKDTVQLGSVIQVEEREQQYYIFIVHEGAGGSEFLYKGARVMAISSTAPIGRMLIGKELGDEIEISTPAGIRTLEILAMM